VLSAAQDGSPTAYGLDKLRAVRRSLNENIERLDYGAAAMKREQSDVARDPVVALRELDRAIRQAAQQPSLRLVEPTRSPLRLAQSRMDMHRQQHLSEQLYAPEASIGVDL
jgi:hypothetical protein